MKYLLALLLFFYSELVGSQDLAAYGAQVFKSAEGKLPYRVLLPSPFDSSRRYPLLIFLHGAYEKGEDNEQQLDIGGRFFLREQNRRDFPAMVIFPQCPANDTWAFFTTVSDSVTGLARSWSFPFRKEPTHTGALLKQLLDSLRSLSFCDSNRIYIGGLSQGGMGVFDLVARYPGYFAAAFPICGAGKTATAKFIAGKTALWIFHGAEDDIVPPRFSRLFFKKIKKAGGDVRYTEYPGVFHDSWVRAFQEKDLLAWVFSKAK